MITNLHIEGFRGFRNFAMEGLGRVNLLVGTNNCGKTTALEAAHILASKGDIRPLWSSQRRRGEDLWEDREREHFMEVRRLFHGHEIEIGSSFHISGDFDSEPNSFGAQIIEIPRTKDETQSQPQLFETETQDPESESILQAAGVAFEWKGQKVHRITVPLTR